MAVHDTAMTSHPSGPELAKRKAKSMREKFDEKWLGEPNSGCWLWTATINPGGYASINSGRRANNRTLRAHRVSWELHYGPIPSGLLVCHRCDTRSCVNPAHLFLGTYTDNNRDKVAKGKQPSGDSHGSTVINSEIARTIKESSERSGILAARFNISARHVAAIRSGELWKCLEKDAVT